MDYTNFKILLVDDEADILEFLSYNLKKEGFLIETAMDGRSAVKKAREFLPHLILMDVMMPAMDGIETCEMIRSIPELSHILIAFLTARAEDYSQIAGFEAGGDDYITKPIKPKLLVSRVKALLKRHKEGDPSGNVNIDEESDIKIDYERYLIIVRGQEMFLPKKEFELLNLLMSKPEKVFTREEIFQQVWGDNIIVGDRTIDVHIRKLREKIGQKYINTVKGVGYKFKLK